MSLLNENITEEIQKQIYVITAKLGAPPVRVVMWGVHLQVNWIANDKSYMWRSDGRDWVEVYDNSEVWGISIANL